MTFNYSTGRTYDAEQILELNVDASTDTLDITDIDAVFKDSSRHITGRVKTIVVGLLTNDNIGAAVLSEYDRGNYQFV